MEGASCLGRKTAVFVRKPAVKNGKEAIFDALSGVPPFGSIPLVALRTPAGTGCALGYLHQLSGAEAAQKTAPSVFSAGQHQ